MIRISTDKNPLPPKDLASLDATVSLLQKARCALALTGAGISVNSGIADFRSPGGVWTRYAPEEYATLEAFKKDPEKTWGLYREMAKELLGAEPNKGHKVLAKLEKKNLLQAIITQNVDTLHQAAGSDRVVEIHGDHRHLACLECGEIIPFLESHLQQPIPRCHCGYPLKPNVVLFGEAVRQLEAIEHLILQCDLLLVVGTSASVYPAASLPGMVRGNGGKIIEFNLEPALAQSSPYGVAEGADYFFAGDLSKSLPLFARAVEKETGPSH